MLLKEIDSFGLGKYLLVVLCTSNWMLLLAGSAGMSAGEMDIITPEKVWERSYKLTFPSKEALFVQDSLLQGWSKALQGHLSKVLGNWWPEQRIRMDSLGYIDFGYLENNSKNGIYGPETKGGIRPAAQHAYSVAVGLHTGLPWSDEHVGSKEDALMMVKTIVGSLARDHLANEGIEHAWGSQWQSSQWASKIAMAAWLIRDALSPDSWLDLERMLQSEADRLLEIPPPSANTDYSTNTHAEENGWDATGLQTACALLPNHPHAPLWYEAAIAYRVNALASPNDISNEKMMAGRTVSDWIGGYNIDTLGALGNHQAYPHPDYMAAPLRHAIEGALFLSLTGQTIPDANFFNASLVYQCFINTPWNEEKKTIYQEDGTIYWPINQEEDWRFEYLTYGLVDAGAKIFGFNVQGRKGKVDWETIHLERAIAHGSTAFTAATAVLLHWHHKSLKPSNR